MRLIVTNPTKLALALCALMAFCAKPAHAQLKLGLRAAPTVAFTRVKDLTRRDVVDSTGTVQDIAYGARPAGINFSGGVVLDYLFRSNYAISSGLFYTVKRAGIEDRTNDRSIVWNLQQIQIPATVKLFTNEIAPDMKLYFQLGGTLDIIITQKRVRYTGRGPEPEGAPFQPIDIGLWFGTGLEYRVAESTTLFGGVSYNRGLRNLVTNFGAFDEKLSPARDRYSIRTDVVALDLGVKF